jgi:RNA polymerase sigma-70 factor (ECF subfamily)
MRQEGVELSGHVGTHGDADRPPCVSGVLESLMDFESNLIRVQRQLLAHAKFLTKNHHDAEDLLQESILKAYRAYDTFEKGTNFRAWMYRIITNTFISDYRKKKKRPDEVSLEEYNAPLVDSSEDTAISQITTEELTELMEHLPLIFRRPLIMAYEGYKYKDIADMMNIPIGTVMSRIHRGRQYMQEMVDDA